MVRPELRDAGWACPAVHTKLPRATIANRRRNKERLIKAPRNLGGIQRIPKRAVARGGMRLSKKLYLAGNTVAGRVT
jgi:hypothetical protein